MSVRACDPLTRGVMYSMSARTAKTARKATKMTYTNPFAYGSNPASREEVLDDQDATYTVVTETDEYLCKSIGYGTLEQRYDTMLHLTAAEVVRAVETLIESNQAVMIIQGRVDNRRDLPTVVPVGYVYPDGKWFRVVEPS